MNGDKFDLNENAKNIIKGKEGRTLNIKNIIKGIVILFAVIAILASFFGAFRSFGKNDNKEEKVEEDLQEKEVGQRQHLLRCRQSGHQQIRFDLSRGVNRCHKRVLRDLIVLLP